MRCEMIEVGKWCVIIGTVLFVLGMLLSVMD